MRFPRAERTPRVESRKGGWLPSQDHPSPSQGITAPLFCVLLLILVVWRLGFEVDYKPFFYTPRLESPITEERKFAILFAATI